MISDRGRARRTANPHRGDSRTSRQPRLRVSHVESAHSRRRTQRAERAAPHVVTFTSPHDALEYVQHHDVDVVISDYRMPEMDGVTFLTAVKKLKPDVARLMLSAFTDLDG